MAINLTDENFDEQIKNAWQWIQLHYFLSKNASSKHFIDADEAFFRVSRRAYFSEAGF